jgi:hypothetical protein
MNTETDRTARKLVHAASRAVRKAATFHLTDPKDLGPILTDAWLTVLREAGFRLARLRVRP